MHRQFAVLMTNALRLTSTKALFAILDRLISDLLEKQRAKIVAVKLDVARLLPDTYRCYTDVVGNQRHVEVDYVNPYKFLRRTFSPD